VPILLPVLIGFVVIIMDKNREVSIEEQAHRLTLEIRSSHRLPDPHISFRTSSGGSGGSLILDREEEDWFIYRSLHGIRYQSDRKIRISYDTVDIKPYYLDIAYKPKPAPFTNWENIPLDSTSVDSDSLILEVRFQIEKSTL